MSTTAERPGDELRGKWRILLTLCLAELLGMAVWFSASAVVPALAAEWQLDDAGRAWLTLSVQIGFVVGAFGSSLLNLADRIPSKRLFCTSAWLAALATAAIPLCAHELGLALALRFLTGLFLAGVYPVGMKIMTTWTRADRGLGIGLLVGALTVGSAMPHLIRVFGDVSEWRVVLFVAAALAASGGLIALAFVEEGPYASASPRFDARQVGDILRRRELLLANVGYLGHMWELYAMWAWIPAFLRASFEIRGVSAGSASLASFAVIAVGGLGSVLAGRWADRMGRTTVAIAALVVSGSCALLVGLTFGTNPIWAVVVCLVWGFAVVADSAQFSACISELCRREYTGTALTLQTSLGFLLTLVTIRWIPALEHTLSWRWAFAVLAIGPVIGVWAMWRLRRSPAASRLAGGRG